jgi:muramoyltetrapeptide carboxypeptidase
LLIEECFLELHDFDEELTHFKLAGVLAQISALIVGKPLDVAERAFPTYETIQDVVLRICAEWDFPILFGLDFGHTRDKLTLPLGLEAEFDSQRSELRIPQEGLSDGTAVRGTQGRYTSAVF